MSTLKKVLVAEDEKVMRFMLCDFLETYNFQVIQAENGKKAWDLWKTESPDLLISDINMPHMSGIELLQRIKEEDKSFPVIIITGVSVDTAQRTAVEYKADGFLAKPFKMKELFDLIGKLI